MKKKELKEAVNINKQLFVHPWHVPQAQTEGSKNIDRHSIPNPGPGSRLTFDYFWQNCYRAGAAQWRDGAATRILHGKVFANNSRRPCQCFG